MQLDGKNDMVPANDQVTENVMAPPNVNMVENDENDKEGKQRDTSRSPPSVELMRQSYVAARVLDGLP